MKRKNVIFLFLHSPRALPIYIRIALPLSFKERGKDTVRWLGVSELIYDKKYFS
jgi:hypothetical protein